MWIQTNWYAYNSDEAIDLIKEQFKRDKAIKNITFEKIDFFSFLMKDKKNKEEWLFIVSPRDGQLKYKKIR